MNQTNTVMLAILVVLAAATTGLLTALSMMSQTASAAIGISAATKPSSTLQQKLSSGIITGTPISFPYTVKVTFDSITVHYHEVQ
jgi:hypothetical protein